MAKNHYEGGATGAAQERVPQPGRGADARSRTGLDQKQLAAMQRNDEKEAAAALRKIKKDIGIQTGLSNPEAMVMTLESVDYDKLSQVNDDLEALSEAYDKQIQSGADPETIQQLEEKKAGVDRVRTAVTEVMQEAVRKDKVYDSEMLGQMLQEKFSRGATRPAESANKALKSLQAEFNRREKEHSQLSQRIEQLTGKEISEVAAETGVKRLWRRGQSAYAGMVNGVRGFFGRISGNEPARYDNAGSLLDRWDSVGVRINQIEDTISDLSPMQPITMKERTATNLEREMLGEEMMEQPKKTPEAPKSSALERFTRIKLLERQLEEASGSPDKLAQRNQWAQELAALRAEDESDLAERRERSAETRKQQEAAEETKKAEALRLKQEAEAEEKRKADDKAAKETAEREAEGKEAREMQEKIAWSSQILGQGQAFNMTEDILGQYGVQATKLEATAADGSKQEYYSSWPNATKAQRDNALAVIFKSAEVQAALPSGDAKEIERLKKELTKLEKAAGLRRSPLLEPAGKAGVGVTLETGREESRRTSGRATGIASREVARPKARRFQDQGPAMEAELISEDYGKTVEEAAAEKLKRDQEEAESVDVDLSGLEEETPETSFDVDLSELNKPKINIKERLRGKGAKARVNLEEAADVARAQVEQSLSKLLNPAALRSERLHNKAMEITLKPMSRDQALDILGIPDLGLLNEDLAVRMAKFLQAEQEGAETSIVNYLKAYALDKAKESGLEYNAKVQEVLLGQRGRKFGKAVGRNLRGASRQEETRRGGSIM
ncbi:MAG: hypothetical protein RDU25_02415 [Patescibacteria group bacterium]|nr:hypothetical protein [Patescibacteria group bacterium]